jgi:hypothetical protein
VEDLAIETAVPKVHQFNVISIIVAKILEAVRKLLTLSKQLFKTAKGAAKRMPPSVNNFRIGEHQLYKANVPKVIWHFVDEEGRFGSVRPGAINI